MVRVGCVEYINALPITLPLQRGEITPSAEFVYAIPSVLNRMLQENELDAALSSCVEYLDGDYNLLPFGIVAHQEVLSVNLYSRLPPTQLSQARVGLTHHSAASVSLFNVLCHHHWKVEPHCEPLNRQTPFSHYDALLLIGDEALEALSLPGFQTIDLAAEWYAMTALPFVFAVLAAKRNLPPEAIHQLHSTMERALKWSEDHPRKIEEEALRRLPLTPELVQRYYACLGYRLGEQERASLKLFRELRDVQTICS